MLVTACLLWSGVTGYKRDCSQGWALSHPGSWSANQALVHARFLLTQSCRRSILFNDKLSMFCNIILSSAVQSLSLQSIFPEPAKPLCRPPPHLTPHPKLRFLFTKNGRYSDCSFLCGVQGVKEDRLQAR